MRKIDFVEFGSLRGSTMIFSGFTVPRFVQNKQRFLQVILGCRGKVGFEVVKILVKKTTKFGSTI